MKSYTDIEQSKKLAEILSLDSADMHYPDYYFDGNAKGPCNTPYKEAIEDLLNVYINPETKRLLPCWGLVGLLGVASTYCNRLEIALRADKNYNIFAVSGDFAFRSFDECPEGYNNPIDACYNLVLKLNELKML